MDFPIGPVTMLAIYFTCWWTVLFAVLPLGMNQRDQERPTDGAQWGAPANPQMGRKFVTTTWISAIVWAAIMIVIWTGVLPLPNVGSA